MYKTRQYRSAWIAILLALTLLAGCGGPVPESSLAELPEPDKQAELPVAAPPGDVSGGDESAPDGASDAVPPEPVLPEDPSSVVVKTNPNTDPITTGIFKLDAVGDYRLYSYDPVNLTYSDMGYAADRSCPELTKVVNYIHALGELEKGEPVAGSAYEGGFMTVMQDGSYEKIQLLLRPCVLEVDGTSYALTQEQYDELKRLSDEANLKFERAAEYLVYMNPGRVIRVDSRGGGQGRLDVMPDNLQTATHILRCIKITSGRAIPMDSAEVAPIPFDEGYTVFYTFDSGVVYTVHADGTTLRVQSSDMNYECRYEADADSLREYEARTIQSASVRMNPATGKPVIYLYPEKATEVSVKLDFDGRVDYTYPDYREGWKVLAQPDGRLTDLYDNSEHYYLFWDGTANRKSWDFSSGFVVKGSDATAFLREKLPLLGLTPREYNDFITYWAPELGHNAYNLISFDTAQYEQTAKLWADPAPDTVIRVHMIFKAVDGPLNILEPVIGPVPVREGFTLVEWGGTRA